MAAAPKEVQAWLTRHHKQPRTQANDNVDASGRKLFEFDCAGDRENRFYGTLYAQDKPLYTLATRRNLLTGEWIRETRRSSTGTGDPTTGSGTAERYFSTRARQTEKDAKQTRLHLAYSEKRLARLRDPQPTSAAVELPFIPLDPVLDTASTSDSETFTLQTETASVEQYLVTQSKTFNEALQQQPHDVDRWLDLVAFQEHSARLARRSRSSSNRTAAQMVADKQAAILDRAIDANPSNRELRLARLNLATQSSSSSPTVSDLEAMVERDPTSAALWTTLVRARQQRFASFSVPSLRELFARILAVLRREVALVVQHETAAAPSTDSALSVQIFDADSLLAASALAPPSYARVLASSERAHELVRLLLGFQCMVCTFELKAGYTERAIVQLQALLAFNAAPVSSIATTVANPTPEQLHSELLRAFAEWWNQDLPHIGDDHSSLRLPNVVVASSPSRFARHVRRQVEAVLASVNPPVAIRSQAHQHRLLQLAAGSLYRKHDDATRGDSGSESALVDERDEAADDGLTYSNVHGYRIKIDTIDDASEYERILAELRGTDASVARQEAQAKKREKQRASAANSVAKFQDERVEYDDVNTQDMYIEWLQQEELMDRTQWNPLRPTIPEHQQLIDESPDRAVLTEEIQPFLFQVPRVLHLEIVLNLLQCVGVRWTRCYGGEYGERLEDVYADGLDEFSDLVAPILRALDPSSTESIQLSTRARRDLLQRELLDELRVSTETLLDSTRVAFVRNALLQLMESARHEGDRESERLAKYLRIEFEAQVVRGSDDDRDAGLSYARELCQSLMEDEDHGKRETSPSADVALMFAYAKLELLAGNHRVVNRICDKTIESLALPTTGDATLDRSFHSLLFMRARSELWVDPAASASLQDMELRKLMALYVLWSCWQRDWEPLDKLVKRCRKHPATLRDQLERVLSADVKAAVIEKYRVELEIAIQQHAKQDKRTTGTGTRQSEWFARVGYCAHNLCLAVYAVVGFHVACSEYEEVIRKARDGARRHHDSQTRWLLGCYLEFIQQHQLWCAFPIVAPRAWRQAVGDAVDRFPHDPVLLRLFVDAETSNTMSQSLRQHFYRTQQRSRRQFDSPLLVEWLFALLCEFARLERFASQALADDETAIAGGTLSTQLLSTCCLFHKYQENLVGMERVRRVFQDMVESVRTRGSALGWRLYVRFEERLGKVENARRVFYRGLATCSWSKELYLDGMRVLRPYLTDEECRELVDFMGAKELHMRDEV